MRKFGRNYELKVEGADGKTIVVGLPFTCEFNILRNSLNSSNICQIRVLNLSELNRNNIRFNITNFGKLRKISFKAGYGDDIVEIFKGNVSQAWSVREGVNWVTQIECFSGGFANTNSFTTKTFPKDTPRREVVKEIAKDLKNTAPGYFGDIEGTIKKDTSYSGDTMSVLSNETGGKAFIDNEEIHVLSTNEYIPEKLPKLIINSSSGLLATPVREETIIRFAMIFEPSLQVARRIEMESETDKNFNGTYKIMSVQHQGVISESVGGSATTSATFLYNKLLRATER